MADIDRRDLLKRISELEAEVADRERDLGRYREELAHANMKLEQLIGQISQELKMAQALHKVLVPTEFPNIPGFEFSTKFVPSMVSGGDYFDIFGHNDRLRFGLVVASSSGHSMSALFLSVLLKMTGQMEARRGAEPHNVLNQLAMELVPHVEGDSSADIFYGLIDRRSYELSFCRVGDVAALYQSYSTGEIRLLDSSSKAIDKNFKQPLVSNSISLNPRDKLILCTRGVTETRNLKGEAFGIERLTRAAQDGTKKGVHDVRNQILYEVQKFAGGQEVARDLTVVVLEVKDRVIKLAKN